MKFSFKKIFKFAFLLPFFLFPAYTDDADVKEEKMTLMANAQLAMSSEDYQVTAGDTYSISFFSNGTSVSYPITVDPTYKIKVANLGTINVAGLTFIQLKNNIETLVSRNYPLGIVSFVMIQPSLFKIMIKGEVSSSQEIQAWALTRLSEIVLQAGLTEFSSMREIKITDSRGKTASFDLFKWQRDGDYSQNPYIRPGDRIEFTRAGRKVSVAGSVERSGTYELLENENLNELINFYAKGTTVTANLSKIQLVRIDDSAEKIRKIKYLNEADLKSNYKLLDKDAVFIYDWDENQPFIDVKGIIAIAQGESAEGGTSYILDDSSGNMYKTRIYFYRNEKYSSFVRRIRKMFTFFSDLENAYVQRGEETFVIEAQKALDEDSFESPYFVEKGDELVIPYKPLFNEKNGLLSSE